MRQVTVDTVISAPPEEIYDFVADLSRRPAYSDHYLKDYRLARANPVGKGAAARFLLDAPVFSQRGELSITEADRPSRIVEEGRMGRLGRSRLLSVYTFTPEAEGRTRVGLAVYGEPKTALDRFKQRRAHRWLCRQSQTALERLRKIFEEPGAHELTRVTIAASEPSRAPRFGAHVGTVREGTVRCSPEQRSGSAPPQGTVRCSPEQRSGSAPPRGAVADRRVDCPARWPASASSAPSPAV